MRGTEEIPATLLATFLTSTLEAKLSLVKLSSSQAMRSRLSLYGKPEMLQNTVTAAG